MNEKQEKVILWIRSGMDYSAGAKLLYDISTNKIQAGPFLAKKGPSLGKLKVQLLKVSKLADFHNMNEVFQAILSGIYPGLKETSETIATSETIETIEPSETTETITSKPLSEYPSIVRRIINDYAELFQERSKLHTTMVNMPESNADSICIKRAELFDTIKSISSRLEELYSAKIEFENTGILPDETELYPVPIETPSMEKEDIKKHKKNLQSSNSKDQTILDYQSKERKDVKTPMPNGPKRIRIEMRINDRKKQIEEIEMQLLRIDQPDAGKEQ